MASTPRKKPAPTRSRGTSRAGSGMSVTFLVVVLFILVLTVFILAFREPLAKLNLAATVPPTSSSPASSASPSATPAASSRTSPRPTSLVVDGGAASPAPALNPSVSPAASTNPMAGPFASPSTKPGASPTASAPAKSPIPSPAASAKPGASPVASAKPAGELKSVTLYFTRVQDDGRIVNQKIVRSVNYSESPLVSSIKALLKGPDGNELSQGLVSMIPAGTSLLSAWVQESVAYLNFSEGFQFNPLGGDGLRAQLRQVVWAATEFPTVKAVQILIEGKKVEFLGGDNVAVGKPLTRSNLP